MYHTCTNLLRILISVHFLLWGFFATIQAQSEVPPIALTLYDTEVKELSETQSAMAGRKITLLLDRYGYIASQSGHNFGIFPKFNVYDEAVMEGLTNITALKIEFSLVAKQVSNGLVVSSCAQIITGSGTTREAAMTNALSNIPTQGKQYEQFFTALGQKINAYYTQNCESIRSEANALAKRREFAAALNTLGQIPREAGDCFDQVQQQMAGLFAEFQKDRCQRMVQAATAEIAAMRYQSALDILALVDPNSTCRNESLKLIREIGPKVNEQHRERWAFMQKAYSDQIALEKLRIEAYREIAKAYYGKSDTLIYTLIVK